MLPKKVRVCAFTLAFALGCHILPFSLVVASNEKEMQSFTPDMFVPLDMEEINTLIEPEGPLTLNHVVFLALSRNQDLGATHSRIQAGRAASRQAGLLANPGIDIEVGNFGGEDDLNGFDGAETTIAISQLFELGGKRQQRKKIASLSANTFSAEYQKKQLDLIADASLSFIEMLAAQERFKLEEEQSQLAQQVFNAVQARVEAGKVASIEAIKARVLLATSRISLQKTRRSLLVNRRNLVAFWGSDTPVFKEASGSLDRFEQNIPALETLSRLVLQHPDIKKLVIEVEKRQVELKSAQAQMMPDLTVSAGMRQFEDTNNTAYLVGISMPIILFDRNQGGISQARHNLAGTRAELAAARINVQKNMNQSYQNLLAREEEAKSLKKEVLPGARAAFEAVQEGYRQGKFNYLEMLEAQKTLFEATNSHIAALSAYHQAIIEVKRLAGLFLDNHKLTDENQ